MGSISSPIYYQPPKKTRLTGQSAQIVHSKLYQKSYQNSSDAGGVLKVCVSFCYSTLHWVDMTSQRHQMMGHDHFQQKHDVEININCRTLTKAKIDDQNTTNIEY